jgi:predicted GTPase
MPNKLTAEELERIQSKHTRWLESNTRNTLTFHGVPILKMLNYELIQHINNIYLNERLKDGS